MKKKLYNKPYVEVVELNSTDILAVSGTMKLIEEEVDPAEEPGAQEKGWGVQW